MTDKDKITFAIRYLKQGLKSKRTPPLYEELMNELGFVKKDKVNNFSGVAVDFFKENYPEYVTEKGECLSPYWDLFSAGVICATFELNNEIAELKAYNEKLLDGDIEKHNKIVELQNRNGELAGQVASLNRWFSEAKEIIQDLLIVYQQFNQTDTYIRAERFLKEE